MRDLGSEPVEKLEIYTQKGINVHMFVQILMVYCRDMKTNNWTTESLLIIHEWEVQDGWGELAQG